MSLGWKQACRAALKCQLSSQAHRRICWFNPQGCCCDSRSGMKVQMGSLCFAIALYLSSTHFCLQALALFHIYTRISLVMVLFSNPFSQGFHVFPPFTSWKHSSLQSYRIDFLFLNHSFYTFKNLTRRRYCISLESFQP